MPESTAPTSRFDALSIRGVWLVWFVLIGIVVVRGSFLQKKNDCYRVFYEPAGLNWFNGVDLIKTRQTPAATRRRRT